MRVDTLVVAGRGATFSVEVLSEPSPLPPPWWLTGAEVSVEPWKEESKLVCNVKIEDRKYIQQSQSR